MPPSHKNHPVGMLATDPDHITMTPLGNVLFRLLATKAVVATCVLLVPLAAVGAVTTPDKVEVPVIDKFPPDTFPDTDSDVSVPTDVTLGCAAVAKVPVIVPETARDVRVPTEVMDG